MYSTDDDDQRPTAPMLDIPAALLDVFAWTLGNAANSIEQDTHSLARSPSKSKDNG